MVSVLPALSLDLSIELAQKVVPGYSKILLTYLCPPPASQALEQASFCF